MAYGSVYFLGSGASVPAGAPTFANFENMASEISHTFPEDIIFKKVLAHWKKEFKEYNIEEYFCAIELGEMITINDSLERKIEVTTDNVIELIKKTIKKSLNNSKSDAHTKFTSNILKINDAVITTNWDILLETEHSRSIGFNYASVGAYKNEHKNFVSRDMDIPLLKLHGSLNWIQCDKCGEVFYVNDKIDSNNNTDTCKRDCEGKLSPIITPPTFSKLNYNLFKNTKDEWKKGKYLSIIWSAAFHRLACSKEIYFIGYSFPVTDAQMKIFVSNALRLNEILDKIVVVTNEKSIEEKEKFEKHYKSVFNSTIESKIQFVYDGFEGFCDSFN